MISALICAIAFGATFLLTRRSLVAGILCVLAVGYAYGIVRANIEETLSHFIFDAAVIGIYAGAARRFTQDEFAQGKRSLKFWMYALIGWPIILFLVPKQDPLIELVGLRGSIFLLGFLLIGALLRPEEVEHLAIGVAVLNLIAFGFAVVEFAFGIELLFPHNQVTQIIYTAKDVANYTAFRIPSTFSNAHSYAGTMVMTTPLILGAWVQEHGPRWRKVLLAASLFVNMIGVFMAASRSHVAVLLLLLVFATFFARMRRTLLVAWLMMLGGLGWLVSSESRLQRFLTLEDTNAVSARFGGSVNENLFVLAYQYPLGNGLAGGGTSVPYFLQDRLTDRVIIESEYARIMAEQGIPGLMLWIAFLVWLFTRRTTRRWDRWYVARRLSWCACAAYFALGLIGIGLLTSIPQSALLLLSVGWIAVRQPEEVAEQMTESLANLSPASAS